MTRILTVYPNCSLGGMTSVYRARSIYEPETEFVNVFCEDKGGRQAFDALSNVDVRFVPQARLAHYIDHALRVEEFDQLRITSIPKLPEQLKNSKRTSVIYEFHSPAASIVRRELEALDIRYVDEVWAPSSWAAAFVESLAPRRMHLEVRSRPNLVDRANFNPQGRVAKLDAVKGIPVSWIGRLENSQKNYLDFLRVLAALPSEYSGLMIYSLETQPARVERFLGDAAQYGVLDRISLYGNVPQPEVAAIHRAVRDRGGVFFSTALLESYGYAVIEAALCGCPVVGFDVGPLAQHEVDGIRMIPVGDLIEARRAIEMVCSESVVRAVAARRG